MGRLIMANDIKTAFNETNITEYGLYPNNVVDSVPAAYDVEKVVEELEELYDIYNQQDYDIGHHIRNALQKAIEIVKAGGMNDR